VDPSDPDWDRIGRDWLRPAESGRKQAGLQRLRYDTQMLSLIGELFDHQAWADATLLAAVRAHPAAGENEKLLHTLHHIVMVQRAFLSIFLQRPFDMAAESKPPDSLDAFAARFRETHGEELAFVGTLDDAALTRVIQTAWFPGAKLTLAQAMMQVIMHSQSHRGQCASRLREAGGQPPTLDYILWLKDRPAPAWS
jgi:uncharacterized damage-inducible protein DinB